MTMDGPPMVMDEPFMVMDMTGFDMTTTVLTIFFKHFCQIPPKMAEFDPGHSLVSAGLALV